MSKYSEFKERFEKFLNIEASGEPYSVGDIFELIGEMLEKLRDVEKEEQHKDWRDFWNQKATELNYGCTPNTYHLDARFRLQKVIRAYDKKTYELVKEVFIENLDEKKLIELGLYGLSDGGEYSIRNKDQMEYLLQYIEFNLDKYDYYFETDAVKVVD